MEKPTHLRFIAFTLELNATRHGFAESRRNVRCKRSSRCLSSEERITACIMEMKAKLPRDEAQAHHAVILPYLSPTPLDRG